VAATSREAINLSRDGLARQPVHAGQGAYVQSVMSDDLGVLVEHGTAGGITDR